MIRGCLLGILLLGMVPLFAQRADYAMFDFYYVPIAGDTVRESIEIIDLRYTRQGQMAKVTHTDGKVLLFDASQVSAFSFIERNHSFLWKHYPAIYHQVQTLDFTQKPSNKRVSVFYETIAECDGYILYRHFVDYDEEFRYLLAKGLVIIRLLPDKMNDARELLLQLMPTCIETIDKQLWPKWARRHYQKIAPDMPQ